MRGAPQRSRSTVTGAASPGRDTSPSIGNSDGSAMARSWSDIAAAYPRLLAHVAEPAAVQRRVPAARERELRVRPLLDQLARVEDEHAVGAFRR